LLSNIFFQPVGCFNQCIQVIARKFDTDLFLSRRAAMLLRYGYLYSRKALYLFTDACQYSFGIFTATFSKLYKSDSYFSFV